MKNEFRPYWCNCATTTDDEMASIDRMEDGIAPLSAGHARIRQLITGLELCHHKSQRWVSNIVVAIGAGDTDKGLGTRAAGRTHAGEVVWQNAVAALSSWCAGCPVDRLAASIGSAPASQLLCCLGDRSPLKEWQVQRVIEKIRGSIHFPQSLDDPSARYEWLLLGGGDYEAAYRAECPEVYLEHENFWEKTVRTMICDTVDGERAELSLGLAIDMLMPCHWGFVDNLRIVLDAIGGNLHPQDPYMACGRNITSTPVRQVMEIICNTLQAYYGSIAPGKPLDQDLFAILGEPTAVKKWLAASLDKTIRLQLNPPPDLREMSALAGPDWIRQ